jgi:vacuolar-type H+-ATPase subunit I/STV1
MSFISIDSVAQIAASEWLKLYRLSPRLTAVGTVVLAVIVGSTIYFTEQKAKGAREVKRLENLSYASQVQKLDETRTNLQALLQFVDDERQNLRVSEQALQTLKKEHEQLRPLVESDRKTVDALFVAQEARNQVAQSTERWVGFGLGVISSLVASFIWAVFSYARSRRNGKTAT